jgi:hypothetical protein
MKSKMKLVSGILSVLVIFTSIPVFVSASTAVDTSVSQPKITGTFPVSIETTNSYVTPSNTFTDGSPKYYLIQLLLSQQPDLIIKPALDQLK